MAKTATSVTPVGVTKHLASLPPQPEALNSDAEMQARVEQDSARIMAAINGTRLLVVPAGQAPSTRLWAARALLAHRGVMPV
ncbi:hypothetical protein [Streptomyces sp. NPDC051016]|uniref:hypothetical protein n=1 Tax=Streptomyces sp. NPDC051016 TaxID=3365638 RepID=UPI0037AE6E1F